MTDSLFTTRETSRAAAQAARGGAAAMRERIFDLIRWRGEYGATDLELQITLGIEGSSQRPRRIELLRAGRIVNSGKTRLTSSGRRAVVWRVKA